MSDAIHQQLVLARKNQILDAAAAVFAQKGFHLTTIRDISKRAGIADGTIYTYFENKTALLLGIFDRMRTEVMQEVNPQDLADVDLRGFLRALFAQALTASREDTFGLFRIVISEMLVNAELRRLYDEQILQPTLSLAEHALQQRPEWRGRPPAETQVLVRVLSATAMGLMLQHSMGDATLAAHWAALPDLLADLMLSGLQHTHI